MPDALTLTVAEVSAHTPTTRLLRLALGDVPFAFAAGQGVAIGRHGQPERRAYSIACAPGDTRRTGALEFLLRTDAAGRLGLHLDGVVPGATVDVEGPFGSFVLPEPLPPVPLVFVAGGTGIAPLRALMRAAADAGHAAPVHLVYSVREATDVAFAAEWDEWEAAGRGEVTLAITRPEGRRPARTRLRIGVDDLARVASRAPDAYWFMCGPPGFVDDLQQALTHLNVRTDHIRRESW